MSVVNEVLAYGRIDLDATVNSFGVLTEDVITTQSSSTRCLSPNSSGSAEAL